MIKLGTNNIGKIYLGSNSIGKAYLGSNLVFKKGSSPTPSVQPVFYDYLVFDGTAKIEVSNLNIPENFSVGVRLGNETNKAAQRIFYFYGSPNGFSAILNSSTTSTTRCFGIYYGGSSAASGNQTLPFSTTAYSFFLTPNRFGWGDTAYTFTKGSSVPTGTLILGMNNTGSGNPYSGTMRSFRIYGSDAQNVTSSSDLDNYTPVYTFKPCTYNGGAGMWCEETSTFHGNTAGAGTLSVRNSE